ncbi:MAG: acylphosphatase [Ruminiclostridium sp.]|jgi:Acylphosphatases|nr:acylphosphatase [Ruminiclostridium sp.]
MDSEYKRKIVRKHIIFYGRVQGVGFRWNARFAAESYGVSGWVRNLYDGSVEMEAEGTEQSIDNMITAIEHGTYIRIEDMTVKDIPVEGSLYFEVK